MSTTTQQEYKVKVLIDLADTSKSKAFVRRVEFDNTGSFIAKYALSKTGDWVEVHEWEIYPEECTLPTVVFFENTEGPK